MHKALRLYPQPQSLDAGQIYEDLDFQDGKGREGREGRENRKNDDRGLPYVVINAVSTLDGKVSRNGTSSGIGSSVDRYVMRKIRSRVDAVLVGAGTIRAEKLSLTVTQELERWRTSRGKSPQPLGVILSREGTGLSPEVLKKTTPNLLVLTEKHLSKQRAKSEKEGRLEDHLRLLRDEYDVETLLVEGGVTVNHSLFKESLVSELFLTLSPKVYGGQELNLVKGGPVEETTDGYKLLSLYSCENELFLRYLVS